MAENFRSRKLGLLLYPEDESHVQAIEKIKAYEYGLILHDRDTDENGEIIKPHYHVVLSLKNAQWATAIAKELGITPNYIQQIRNEESALEYLIHYNDNDKYKYEIDAVQGSLKRRLIEYINKSDTPESDKVAIMIQYVEENANTLSVTKFSKFCAASGYWDVFRRSGAIFIKILEEHNHELFEKNIKKKFDR